MTLIEKKGSTVIHQRILFILVLHLWSLNDPESSCVSKSPEGSSSDYIVICCCLFAVPTLTEPAVILFTHLTSAQCVQRPETFGL